MKLSSTYYPQTNGSTERMNRTITQMLRQCISPKQKDWIYKLLMIEYTINTAQLETTGYTPFFLNYEQMLWNLLWNDSRKDEYPGVRTFVQKVKDAILQVYDAIL